MTEHKVSYRYAKAAIESAVKENMTDLLLNDLHLVRETLISSADIRSFIKSPVIIEKNKNKVLTDIFSSKISKQSLNFILFLISKGRGELIIDVINRFEDQYNKLNGRIKVEFNTAIELTDEIKKNLISKIESYTGKTVLPLFKVQESIKGGLMVRIEDWVFDASLKSQLENLYDRLSKN